LETARSGKCGRKRKTTPREDAIVHRMSVKNPRLSSFDLSREASAIGIELAPSSVRKRLLAKGRRARRPIKKQLLTRAMRKKRLDWARAHRHWGKDEWKKVLFSDETHFEVRGFKTQFVRRSENERISEHHLEQTVKHPPKKMFWGCFSVQGTGGLLPVEGMMNSTKYEAVVKRKVIPVLRKRWPDGSGVFQQDKAPCHVSHQMLKFFKQNKVRVLEWPGNSPDLNPIENLWAILKKRLQKRDCTTMDKLINNVIDVWFKDSEMPSLCVRLIESMPERVEQVIKARGGHTSY
jgi:hypothetical protein